MDGESGLPSRQGLNAADWYQYINESMHERWITYLIGELNQ